jgi:hypothetical protein
MRRRRLLTATAAALTAGLAGCSSLGLGGGDGGDGTTPGTTEQTTQTTQDASDGTTTSRDGDGGTQTTSSLPPEAALLPEAATFGDRWSQLDVASRSGGVVGNYERTGEEEEWQMAFLLREFDSEDGAASNLEDERERLESYAGVTITEADAGDGAFGVSRTRPTAVLWFQSWTIVSSIEVETDYRFKGGGPEIAVGDLVPFAEAAIGSWE